MTQRIEVEIDGAWQPAGRLRRADLGRRFDWRQLGGDSPFAHAGTVERVSRRGWRARHAGAGGKAVGDTPRRAIVACCAAARGGC